MATSFDVVLDVRVPHNRNPFFYPAQKVLRGEAQIAQIAAKNVPGVMAQIGGVIPGHQVQVDTKGKRVKIVDRMGFKENAELLRKMRDVEKRSETPFPAIGDPDPDEEFKSTDEEWPTWLYHIRQMVEHGRLHFVKGEGSIPSIDEIRRMGVIRLGDQGNVPPKDPKRPWNFLYPDEVPETAGVSA